MTDPATFLDAWHPNSPIPHPPAGLSLRAEQMWCDTWTRLPLDPDAAEQRDAVELLCRLRYDAAEEVADGVIDPATVAALLEVLYALGL